MRIEYPELVGKRLADVEPELVAEMLEHLSSGDVSPAAYQPTADEIARLMEQLKTARVRSRCGCGQDDCRTYNFQGPGKERAIVQRTVRLFVRGEALLHIDSEGNLCSLERLYDWSERLTDYLCRHHQHGILLNVGIPRNERQRFDLRLRDHNTVERVSMNRR